MIRSDRVSHVKKNSTRSNTGGYAIELSMIIYIYINYERKINLRTRLKCIYIYKKKLPFDTTDNNVPFLLENRFVI